MLTAAELAKIRSTVADLFVDRCTITRPSEGGTVDDSLRWTPDDPTTVAADVPCIIARAGEGAPDNDLAGAEWVQHTDYVCRIAADAAVVQVDDRVTVTTATHDDTLTDRRFRVADITSRTLQAQQVLRLEDVTS